MSRYSVVSIENFKFQNRVLGIISDERAKENFDLVYVYKYILKLYGSSFYSLLRLYYGSSFITRAHVNLCVWLYYELSV